MAIHLVRERGSVRLVGVATEPVDRRPLLRSGHQQLGYPPAPVQGKAAELGQIDFILTEPPQLGLRSKQKEIFAKLDRKLFTNINNCHG